MPEPPSARSNATKAYHVALGLVFIGLVVAWQLGLFAGELSESELARIESRWREVVVWAEESGTPPPMHPELRAVLEEAYAIEEPVEEYWDEEEEGEQPELPRAYVEPLARFAALLDGKDDLGYAGNHDAVAEVTNLAWYLISDERMTQRRAERLLGLCQVLRDHGANAELFIAQFTDDAVLEWWVDQDLPASDLPQESRPRPDQAFGILTREAVSWIERDRLAWLLENRADEFGLDFDEEGRALAYLMAREAIGEILHRAKPVREDLSGFGTHLRGRGSSVSSALGVAVGNEESLMEAFNVRSLLRDDFDSVLEAFADNEAAWRKASER